MNESPQIESGFIQIATGCKENDVLAALARCQITGAEFQILLHVIRQTWGYKKQEDWISLSQFQKATARDRSHIVSCLNRLVASKLLVASRQLGKKTQYGFNKRFSEWVVASRQLVASSPQTSSLQPTQLVASRLHTKESITKETNTKETVTKVTGLTHGNPNISKILSTLREYGSIDGTVGKNRQFASLLLKKAAKEGQDECSAADALCALIHAVKKDDFWGPKLTSVVYLFYNIQRLYNEVQAKTPKVAIIS